MPSAGLLAHAFIWYPGVHKEELQVCFPLRRRQRDGFVFCIYKVRYIVSYKQLAYHIRLLPKILLRLWSSGRCQSTDSSSVTRMEKEVVCLQRTEFIRLQMFPFMS